jgi:hypothetical protein
MLEKRVLNRVKDVKVVLEHKAEKLKEMMEDEVKAIVASIDETMQKQHIEVFQELVITQTIITLQLVLIDALLDKDFEDEEEAGAIGSIDVLTDCLQYQEFDLKTSQLASYLADNDLLDLLESENATDELLEIWKTLEGDE